MNEIAASAPFMFKVFRGKPLQKVLSWLVLVSFLPLAMSCNYYRLKEEREITTAKVTSLPNYKRFILHQNENAWELREIAVQEANVTGKLIPIPKDLIPYVNPKSGSSHRFRKVEQPLALNIVHLYVNEFAQDNTGQAVVPVSSIKRMDITDKDTGATVASHILVGLAGTVAVLGLVGVIVALTKSSCPFVYVQSSNGHLFIGEAYGGAIFSPLERDDYMPLRGWDENATTVKLKITNELKERQYTNLAQLLVVQHQKGTQVLLDQKGNPHSLQHLTAPVSALASDGQDYAQVLAERDSAAWLFSHTGANNNQVMLQFQKPAQSKAAKLVLHAQNSLWLDYLYGEFTKQFGGIYNRWAEQQKDVPAAELYQWQQEQGIPLLVEVQTATGWKVVERIQPVGPLASRDLVVPINLAQVSGEEVNVRLSCGFMFWEIDKAGMDFTPNLPLTVQTVRAAGAFENSGQNVQPLLASSDGKYLHQFNVGDAVQLTFSLPKMAPDLNQSVFLHTRGYYEHIRDYSGIPNLLTLRAFEKPGHFMQFSRQRYTQIAEQNNFNHLVTAHASAR